MTLQRRCSSWLPCPVLILGAFLGLPGCGGGGPDESEAEAPPAPGGQTGEETLGCVAVERDMLAWSELSSLGFSADNLLNQIGSESAARLSWSSGGATSLTVAVERTGGSVEYQARAYSSGGSGTEPAAEIGSDCSDVLAIPVLLSFSTADGAFAETWPVTLLAASGTSVTTLNRFDLGDLEGTFTVSSIDPSDYDEVFVIVELTFLDGAWTGTLSGQANRAGASGVASSQSFAIASF